MGVFDHNKRAKVTNVSQHLLAHSAGQVSYSSEVMPGVSRVSGALNWIAAMLYPRYQDAVATPADLPLVGNTLLDYRVVLDDGDGKAAGYRWDQWEGEVAPSWHKIADMDWSGDAVLGQFLAKTQDVYVYRYGYNDVDKDGVVRTGDLAGQHIYGGAAANTHLTLFANSGDGVGAATGFVQFADNARPLVDSAVSLGTSSYRWSKAWFDDLESGTLRATSGLITDSSGAISFADENLVTTGTFQAGDALVTGLGVIGNDYTLVLDNGVITSTRGTVSFGDNAIATTGGLAAASAQIGDLSISGDSVTSSSGEIDFDDDDLVTDGSVVASDLVAAYLGLNDIEIDGVFIRVTTTDENLWLEPNGTGQIVLAGQASGSGLSLSGLLRTSDAAWIDNLYLDGNSISSVNTNGAINLAPNGTGIVTSSAKVTPTTNGALDLGATATRWADLYMSGSISDGTSAIAMATLLSFRDALSGVSAGMALFYNGTKWVASLPDTEVDHGTLSGLGDDDHAQYALLAGRSGGQTLYGSTLASQNLVLDSTSHGTKGSINVNSDVAPVTDAARDLGAASFRFKDLYTSGQLIGARLQNATTAARPSASAGNIGRMIYDTDLQDVMIDRGGTWKKLSLEKYVIQDASTWNGSATTQTYTVSSEVSDARECIWVLKSNADTFRQMAVDITMTQTTVTVTVAEALPSGTYTLVGIG